MKYAGTEKPSRRHLHVFSAVRRKVRNIYVALVRCQFLRQTPRDAGAKLQC